MYELQMKICLKLHGDVQAPSKRHAVESEEQEEMPHPLV